MTVFSPEAVRAMVAPIRMTVLARLPGDDVIAGEARNDVVKDEFVRR